MKRKHTPGPWNMDKYGNIKSGDTPIACGGVWLTNTEYSPEAKANSALITAAPELLEAAKSAVPFLESLGYVGGDIVDNLKAAIAKAEGE